MTNADMRLSAGIGSVDWHSYARCYDLLCGMNPSYAELIEHFTLFLRQIGLDSMRVLDVGAGTGNFVLAGARAVPSCTWTHLDADEVMNGIARDKYSRAGLSVRIVEERGERASFRESSFDLIVSVNAMYAMPKPEEILTHMTSWLAPGGYLYLVDLGRIQNTLDWTQYLVRANARRIGIWKTVSTLLNEGRVISSQNRRITELQRSGVYWKHSATELSEALHRSGFQVQHVGACYRGYSDRAIARNAKVLRHQTLDESDAPTGQRDNARAARDVRPRWNGETDIVG